MSKHITSVFDNEPECIKAILDIHNGGKPIDLDPMFFKGGFYKSGAVERPRLTFDLVPRDGQVIEANAEALPLISGSIDTMILDPLFLFGIHGNAGKYYTSRTMGIFKDFAALENHYKAIIKEAHRLLKNKGLLIFKCQDYTDSKTTMTHCLVYEWAKAAGFYAKDIAILNIPQTKIYNPNLTQRHFRKTHCYFWVFQKRGRKT